MPEYPEITGFIELLRKRTTPLDGKSDTDDLLYKLVIHPRVFSIGTEKKPWETLTVDTHTFSDSKTVNSMPSPTNRSIFGIDSYDSARAAGKPWEYLLYNNSRGPLQFCRRGKLMVLAAGKHAMLIHFGLEGHLIHMTREDYDEIIAHDVPGANHDATKSAMLRSFVLPSRFMEKFSSKPREVRTINILGGFVSKYDVWVLVDFSRIARMHVFTNFRDWASLDFSLDSRVWEIIWIPFRGGPDWILERQKAESCLEAWKNGILEENGFKPVHANHRMEFFFPLQKKARTTVPIVSSKKHPGKPIIKQICQNAGQAFSGFGRHCANDLLYRLNIFPGTPSFFICADPVMFERLKASIFTYLFRFQTPDFLKTVATTSNSNNPLKFNERSNEKYISCYIDVFRRTKVLLSKETYHRYQRLGIFDENHILGSPYPASKHIMLKAETIWVPVYYYGEPLKAYSIIAAITPPLFMSGPMKLVNKDIGDFVYATTIGCAQFREQVQNRIDYRLPAEELLYSKTGGRRTTVKTNQRGRPATNGLNKAQIKRLKSRIGRQPISSPSVPPSSSSVVPPPVIDSDDDDDGSDNDLDDGLIETKTLTVLRGFKAKAAIKPMTKETTMKKRSRQNIIEEEDRPPRKYRIMNY